MRPAEGSGIWKDAIGRAAYLVGWTEPLRRAWGVIGEVGGGGSIARDGSDHAGGTLPWCEGPPMVTAGQGRARRGGQEPAAAGRSKGWA